MKAKMAVLEGKAGELVCTEVKQPILVFGDIMLDSFVDGGVSRISPEAPVPVLCNPSEELFCIGGAGNVAHNLHTLGNSVRLVAGVGRGKNGAADAAGEILLAEMQHVGLAVDHLVQLERITTVKQRIVSGKQQLLRIDKEDCRVLSGEEEENVLQAIEKAADGVAAICISDYAKGMLSERIAARLAEIAKQSDIPLLADVKLGNYGKLRGVSLLKPNLKEAQEFSGIPYDGTIDSVGEMARALSSASDCNVVVTCGSQGVVLCEGGELLHLRAQPKEVFDLTGAGDTSLAALAHGLARGLSLEDSAILAMTAAGIAITKRGVFAVPLSDIKTELTRTIVPKLWGHEEWIVNADYCGKKLVLNKGYCCSLHYHKIKDETFYIASGKVGFQLNDKKFILHPGDSLLITPGTKHRFYGLEDSEIFEFSTHHLEEDSYRDEVSGTFEHAEFDTVPDYKSLS